LLSRLRSYRPGHGTVVAYLALFVALGGTSYGVATGSIDGREIKNNTVRSKDIRNNAIRGRDVRTGTLRSSDVADRSLLGRDFAPGQLPAGPQGPAGRDGFDQVTRNSIRVPFPSGASDRLVVHCERGTAPTGGSAIAQAADNGEDVTNQVVNGQTFDGGSTRVALLGWAANATNNTGEDVLVYVDVACATADNINFP